MPDLTSQSEYSDDWTDCSDEDEIEITCPKGHILEVLFCSPFAYVISEGPNCGASCSNCDNNFYAKSNK